MRLGMRCRLSPSCGRAVAHVRGSYVPHNRTSYTAAIGNFFRSLRRPGRATSVARKTHRSLAQIPLHSHEVASQERSQDQVNDDRRPQKDAGQTTCETEISKV